MEESEEVLHSENGADDSDEIAAAAEEAAEAVEAQDALSQQQLGQSLLRCRICGWGSEEGRPVLRFMPLSNNAAGLTIPSDLNSFAEDIALHIFCGKTASILPNVNRPDLEILTKAGLKNKHGIGPEVNAALARTRCAALQQEGAKEKHFYLVREFETHLRSIRSGNMICPPGPATDSSHDAFRKALLSQSRNYAIAMSTDVTMSSGPTSTTQQGGDTENGVSVDEIMKNAHQGIVCSASPMQGQIQTQTKQPPIRASVGQIPKPGSRQMDETQPVGLALTKNGKIKCKCGGTHLPGGTAKGASSHRSHIMTQRHQRWLFENDQNGEI